MPLIKDHTFFKNAFFGQKNRLPMQKYLNEMSENGYHLVKIGKFKCVFSEEASKRYIYSLCAEGDESLYTLSTEWESFLSYKDVLFFRKEIPADAVAITRSFGKKQIRLEKSWLGARLAEGLVLIGRIGNEYIFRRSDEFRDHEYVIKQPDKKLSKKDRKKGKTEDSGGGFEEIKDMKFVTVSDNGDKYYFLNNARVKNTVTESRGKRLSDQLLALFIATGSALAFCASVLFTLFGAFSANVNGKSVLPWALIGGAAALIFAALFVTFFLRFQKIAEIRKIRAEEKRARLDSEQNAPPPEEPSGEKPRGGDTNNTNTNNNTVVMNTVVLNSYGKKGKKKASESTSKNVYEYGDDEEFDPNLKAAMGQVFDGEASGAFDPSVNPAISAAKNPTELAQAVMRAASAQQEQPYEDKTDGDDGDDGDIWQGEAVFGTQKTSRRYAPPESDSIYEDEEWVGEEDSESEDGDGFDEYGEDNEGFPIIQFIGCAILCFISVVAFSFGLRYGIAWFAADDKGNVLTLALSALAIAFSPFLFRFGFLSCKDMLYFSDDGHEE